VPARQGQDVSGEYKVVGDVSMHGAFPCVSELEGNEILLGAF
jgi:hypothetical protein